MDTCDESTEPQTSAPESKTEEKSASTSRKRRASSTFGQDEATEEFHGFGKVLADSGNKEKKRLMSMTERLQNELNRVSSDLKPVRTLEITPSTQNKRPRRESPDVSRPSSGLSFNSNSEGLSSSEQPLVQGVKIDTLQPTPTNKAPGSTPSNRRSITVDMSSPLLLVPLNKGWKRELVYRAALDAHSRRNADVYYYTPAGKKLRSTREVAENLAGTDLTLDNFSFFKEALGVDDPEKEVIREAKIIRRAEPVTPTPAQAPVEGKRQPKPKAPKGASPEPTTSVQPAKIKVKSLGSRLSNNTSNTPPAKPQKKSVTPASTPAATDNNNTSWKKPSKATPTVTTQHRPPEFESPPSAGQSLLQPCSMACANAPGDVPTLSCESCLCMFHPQCVGRMRGDDAPFYCKKCSSESAPQLAMSKSMTSTDLPSSDDSWATPPSEKRVLLRMKVSAERPGGERVWSVTKPKPVPSPSLRALAMRSSRPQSIAIINGKKFVVVPRTEPPANPFS